MRTGDEVLDELGAELIARGADLIDPGHERCERLVPTLRPAYAGQYLWVWASLDGRRYLCRYWQYAGPTSAPDRTADTIMAMLSKLSAADAGRR